MKESQIRELVGKGLPKFAEGSINAVYPLGFKAVEEPARDFSIEAQAVGSQLLYTRNFQVCSFLIMDPGVIFKLGQKVFPKYERMEIPKMAVSANSEELNTIMGKLGYLIGKVDGDGEVTTAPPIVLNCTGPDRVAVRGGDSLFLRLDAADLSMRIIASVQQA